MDSRRSTERSTVNLDEAKSGALDGVLEAYASDLRDSGDETAAVTLAYTHSLHRPWRTALRMLPVPSHWSVLDVGCGLGILDFELVANLPIRIVGIDIEPGFVGHAEVLRQRLAASGLFVDGASLRFEVGDIRALAFADKAFDLVFVRELLQFLPDPLQAVDELFRVLRPGAFLCISDSDDQLRITWPPASEAFERLVAAVKQVQHERGGDRQTGRKLTTYLRTAGFEIASVVVLPEAQHRLVNPGEVERALVIEQLHAARERVVSAGAMDPGRFDADLAALEQEEPFEEFRMNARIIVLGRKPEAQDP
jgi:ubiquinone/menaquinone biosynthesis C-methylase UbiE